MKPAVLASCLFAATFGIWTSASAQETIRIGTEGAFPPFGYLDENGELAGFERDLGDALCADLQLRCEWVLNAWDSIIPNLMSGNYDMIVSAMSITDERREAIDFSVPYMLPDPSAFVGLAGAGEEVRTGIVAAQTGTVEADHVAQSEATLVEFASPDETVAAVRNGQADAVFASRAFLLPNVEASGGELVFIGDIVLIGDGIGIGFRKSDSELRARFDGAIDAMRQDGRLNAMIRKWFGADHPVFQ